MSQRASSAWLAVMSTLKPLMEEGGCMVYSAKPAWWTDVSEELGGCTGFIPPAIAQEASASAESTCRQHQGGASSARGRTHRRGMGLMATDLLLESLGYSRAWSQSLEKRRRVGTDLMGQAELAIKLKALGDVGRSQTDRKAHV